MHRIALREDGKRLLVCENNQLSLSGDDFTENTLYRCLEGTSLQAVMKNYIGEEQVYKSSDSATLIETIEREELPEELRKTDEMLRVYEDSGSSYSLVHLHLSDDEANATYGMAVQFLKDDEWITASGYPLGEMIDGASDYYFLLEASEGLLRLGQLRASKMYLNDPVVTFHDQDHQSSKFYIGLADAVNLHAKEGVVIASTRASDVGMLVDLSESSSGTDIEVNKMPQRLVLLLE